MRTKLTIDQEEDICFIIGIWYSKWKGKITDGEMHRLGVAKEELKHMICECNFVT
jgi:hypothetical protein